MNMIERFVEVAKSGMESVGIFSGQLFEGAQNAFNNVTRSIGDVFEKTQTKMSETLNNVQQKTVESMVKQLGPDVIEVGIRLFEEEAREISGAIFNGVNSKNLFAALNLPAQSFEEQFENLLDAAQSGLDSAQAGVDELAENSTSPLRKKTCLLASRLIEKGMRLNQDLSKAGRNAIKGFKKELREAQPIIERELSKTFFEWFFLPIINFLSNLLKSFFTSKIEKTNHSLEECKVKSHIKPVIEMEEGNKPVPEVSEGTALRM